MELLKALLTNPIILTVAAIEFCSGILRNGIMHWYVLYAKSELVLPGSHFMRANWGLVLFFAGVGGASFAGLVSDKLFQSRRGPAAGALYGGMAVAVVVMIFTLGGTKPEVGWIKEPVKPGIAAGLKTGDRIIAVDDKAVKDRSSVIATLEKEGTYRLKVLRVEGETEISLTTTKETLKELKLRKSMVTLKDQDIGGEKRVALHWQGAWAYEGGLRKGDIIKAVNGEEPKDWGQVQKLMKTDGTANQYLIEREGGDKTLVIPYPAYAPQTRELKATFMKVGPVQTLNPLVLGFIAFFIYLCVIGSHGLLSGTASMDFGGKKGTATAVGVIDGAVYLGTGIQSFALGYITARDWSYWPIFLLPFAIIGFLLCLKIWNAKPRSGGGH